MQARINHGRRGTKIGTLLRQYKMKNTQDYYDYIVESFDNGQRDQAIELFNRMKGDQQKCFLLNINHYYDFGRKVHEFIIKSM